MRQYLLRQCKETRWYVASDWSRWYSIVRCTSWYVVISSNWAVVCYPGNQSL